jgi:hypothetical protein
MSQIDTNTGIESSELATGVQDADPQPAAVEPGAGGAAGGQDGQGVVVDGDVIRVPRYSLAKEYEGRWERMAQDAAQFRGIRKEFWVSAIEAFRASGKTPEQCIAWARSPAGQAAQAQAEADPAVQRQASQPGQVGQRKPKYDENFQPIPDPADDPVLKAIAERDKKYQALESKLDKMISDNQAREHTQTARQTQQQYAEAQTKSNTAMEKAIRETLGVDSQPVKRSWLGRPDQEVNRAFRNAQNEIVDAVFEMRKYTGTAAEMTLGGYPLPPTSEEIAFVAGELKGDYQPSQTSDLEAARRVAEQHKNKPRTAPPRGGGGGASRAPKKDFANDEERKEAVMATARPLLEGMRGR